MNPGRRTAIHDALTRLCDGDRSAFDLLVDELWPEVLAFARRGLGTAQDAEDIAQEVFVRLCARISEFDRTRDGLSWALGIASYELMTHRLRLRRRRETLDDDALSRSVDHSASPESAVAARELTAALEAVLGELSAVDREALALDEVKRVDLSGPTLRKRRQRALARLRELWRRFHG